MPLQVSTTEKLRRPELRGHSADTLLGEGSHAHFLQSASGVGAWPKTPSVEVVVVGCFLFYFSIIYHGGLQGFE